MKMRPSRVEHSGQETLRVKLARAEQQQEQTELERELACKTQVATKNRDTLIESRIQRIHVDHVQSRKLTS